MAAPKAATPKGLSELQERLLGYTQEESKNTKRDTRPMSSAQPGLLLNENGKTNPPITLKLNGRPAQLHDNLRRHGLEGEEAFLVVAAQYLSKCPKRRKWSFFPVDRSMEAARSVRGDRALSASLARAVASDPQGHQLPTWYQFFVGRRFREGSGKFFTPQAVASAMAQLLPRHAGAVVMDPTCGGGTFLREASRHWQGIPCQFVGNDVDRMLVGLAELVLTLSVPTNHRCTWSCLNLYDDDLAGSGLCGKVNGILANPPFSLALDRVANPGGIYRIGYRNSDAIFLDVCLELLAPGGSLVCLLPHSLVANSEFEQLRQTVERYWNLHGVVTLPEGVFYLTGNTTTRADIIHLQKKPSRRPSKSVFFANAPSVGIALNSRTTGKVENALALVIDDPRVKACVASQS